MSISSYQLIPSNVNTNCYPIDLLNTSIAIQRVNYVKTDVDIALTIRRPHWKRTYVFKLDQIYKNYHLIDINLYTGWVVSKTVKRARRGLMHDFCVIIKDDLFNWKEIQYKFPNELKLTAVSYACK